jgi:hypothetical protein
MSEEHWTDKYKDIKGVLIVDPNKDLPIFSGPDTKKLRITGKLNKFLIKKVYGGKNSEYSTYACFISLDSTNVWIRVPYNSEIYSALSTAFKASTRLVYTFCVSKEFGPGYVEDIDEFVVQKPIK